LLFTALYGTAQNMQGTITDLATGQPMYLVSVINSRTQLATTSDASGFYNIPAETGDEIRFSFVGYRTLYKLKPTAVLIANINVLMEQAETELKEVVLHSGKYTRYQLDSIERVTTYKLPLQRTPPSALVSPVSAIAELFSQKAKRTYQFQKDFWKGETEKFIDTRYTHELVTKLTGLTEDSMAHFMNAYPMPYDFARTATDLEIKMWVREHYKQWMDTVKKGGK
jgi:hypothetical protein